MPNRRATSPSRARRGEQPTSSVPARSDIGENSASELIEAPRKPGDDPLADDGEHERRPDLDDRHPDPLDAHDFPDGGGSGGGEAFSRVRLKQRGKG